MHCHICVCECILTVRSLVKINMNGYSLALLIRVWKDTGGGGVATIR